MEQEKFTYMIGGEKFIQRPLVNGQIRQLMKIIEGMVIPKSFDPVLIMSAFGEQLSNAMAIVLREANAVESKSEKEIKQYLRSRDIAALSADIEWSIAPETAVQVIEDFFDCNPIASLLEKMAALGAKFNRMKKPAKSESTPSSPSSPEEISPSGTMSSGDSPPQSASHT